MASEDPTERGITELYTEGRELGRGSRGAVYLVHQASDGEAFAMRRVPFHGASNKERASAAIALASLRGVSHPGCMWLADSAETDTELCILTEFCPGGDLLHWSNCRSERSVSIELFRYLAVSLLQPLEYLHQKGMLHRNIKPSNILVTATGAPKLSHFGAYHTLASTLRGRANSQTSVFTAPEVLVVEDGEGAVPDGSYTEKADIWSLGATFYALLSGGKPPLATKDAVKLLAHDPASWRVPPLPQELHPSIVQLVSAMLVADPNVRPYASDLLRSSFLGDVEPLSSAVLAAAATPSIGHDRTAFNHAPAPKGRVYAAAECGDAPTIRRALVEGCSTEEADEGGNTAVAVAAMNGHFDAVRVLLEAGSCTSTQSKDGSTPLLWAAQEGHSSIVSMFLADPDVEVNKALSNGATSLFFAAQNSYSSVVELLVADSRVDVNLAHSSGATPLFVAAQNGHAAVVERLVADPRVNVNQAMTDGATPLCVAADQGHVAVVSLLLAHALVDVNKAMADGATPLLLATQNGFTSIVSRLLVDRRLVVDESDGQTALAYARKNGDADIVALLEASSGAAIRPRPGGPCCVM